MTTELLHLFLLILLILKPSTLLCFSQRVSCMSFFSSYFSLPLMHRKTQQYCPCNNNLGMCDSNNTPLPGAFTSMKKHTHHPHRKSMQPHSFVMATVHTSLCHNKVHCPLSVILIITFTLP